MARILKITDPRTGEIYRVNWEGEMPTAEQKKQILLEQRGKKGAKATEEEPSSFMGGMAGAIDKVLNLPKKPLLAIGSKVAGVPLSNYGDIYREIAGLGTGYQPEENLVNYIPNLPTMGPGNALVDILKSLTPEKQSAVVGSFGEMASDPLLPLTGGPGRVVAGAGAVSAGLHSADEFNKGNNLAGTLYGGLAALGAHGARGPKVPEAAAIDDLAAVFDNPAASMPHVPQGAKGSIPAKPTDVFQPDVFTAPKTEMPPRPELPALPPGKPSFKAPDLPTPMSPGQPINNLDPFSAMFPQPQTHPNFVEAPLDFSAGPLNLEEAPLALNTNPTEVPLDFTPPTPPENVGPVRGGTASRSGVFFERNPTDPRSSITNPFELDDARNVAGMDIELAPEGKPRLTPLDKKIADKNTALRETRERAEGLGTDYVSDVLKLGRRAARGQVSQPGVNVYETPQGTIVNFADPQGNIIASGRGSEGKLTDIAKATRMFDESVAPELSKEASDAAQAVRSKLHELGFMSDEAAMTPAAKAAELRNQAGKAPDVDKAYGGIPIDALLDDIKTRFPKFHAKAAELIDFIATKGAKNINLQDNIFSFTNPDGQLVKYDLPKLLSGEVRFGDRLLRMNKRARGTSLRDAGLNPRSELPQYVGGDKPKVRYAQPSPGGNPNKAGGMTVVPRKATVAEKAVDILNIPRTMKSTADISMPLRQGLLAMAHDPEKGMQAIGQSLKAAVSEDRFDDIMHDVVLRPTAKAHAQSGLAITIHPKHAALGQQLTQREEAWLSTLPEKVPGLGSVIRGSNRAAVAFLNKMRADIFDDLVGKYQKMGVLTPDAHIAPLDTDLEFMKNIAKYTNMITGRGGLGKQGERIAPALQGLLFSPRLVASRLQSMGYALPGGSKAVEKLTGGKGLNPEMVAELRKDWAKLGVTFAGVAGLAKMIPGVEIETDPRSTDFLKIKYKNTRLDLGGGHLQYLTAGARALTGEVKDPRTGDVKPAGGREGRKSPIYRHAQPVARLVEGKLNPPASLAKTAYTGRNFLGVKFDPENPWHWAREGTDMITPISPQDMYALSQEQDPFATMLLGGLGVLGAGVETYDPEDRESRNPDRFQEDVEDILRRLQKR